MLKKYKDSIRDILIIFVLSLTPLLWFRPGTLMVGHDNVAPLDPKVFLEGRLSTWSDHFFGQSQELILGTIPIHLLDAMPSFFGFSVAASQKIVYVMWFFLIGLSAYLLALVIKPKSFIFKFVAVIFYQFNFFILQGWWIGEKSKFSAYVAMPLVLAVFLAVESGRIPILAGAFLNSFIFFFFNAGGLFGIPLYGGLFVTIGSFIVFSFLTHLFTKNIKSLRRLVILTILTAVLSLAVNAYYIFPAVMKLRSQLASNVAAAGGISGVISWAAEISASASFLNLMRLQGIPEWYDNPEHPYAKIILSNPFFIAVSFLWALLVFASLFLVRERAVRRFVFYFFILYLLGIFFAAGTHPPLGFLYQLLVEKVPGFIIFRTPYFKFAPALYLASTYLTAFVIDALARRFGWKVFGAFLIIIFTYHFPFFTGNFFEWRSGFSTRLAVPSYVFDFGTWLQSKHNSERVLMVPPNSPDLQYGLYNWGYLSFQAIPTLLSNTSVVVNNDKLNSQERNLVMALYDAIEERNKQKTERLFSLLNISHVLILHDTDSSVRSFIPLNADVYAQGLNSMNIIEPEISFGQYDVYKVLAPASNLFLVDTLPIIDASHDDVSIYSGYPIEGEVFLLKADAPPTFMPQEPALIVPVCANCLKKSKPIVVFPERNILPGDPFYSFVLMAERLRKAPTEPKSAIYNALGISLKRISEINEMLFGQKTITKDIVDRYISLLDSIEDNFFRLPTPQDKIIVGSDIAHYLHAERNFLRPNLGQYVTAGPQTVLTGTLFSAIHRLENILTPFIADLEESNSRIYYFNLDAPTTFEVLLKREDIAKLLESKTSFRLKIDGAVERNPDSEQRSDAWLSFGNVAFEKGFHTMKLILPEENQAAYPLSKIETEFSVQSENVCFGTALPDVNSGKLYKTLIRYRNDFSDNLIFFAWEKEKEETKLLAAVKLPASPFEEKVEEIFDVSAKAEAMIFAVCAPNLTQNRAEKQFVLRIGEATYPSMMLSLTQRGTPRSSAIMYKKVSSTQYELQLPDDISYPATIIFPERFDAWWELKGAPAQHIKVNDYANGWIIERNPEGLVYLEYQGGRYARKGILLTASIFILAAVFMRKKIRNIDA